MSAKKSWLTGGILATVGALVVCGAAGWFFLRGSTEVSKKSETQSYSQSANRIELDLFSGDITISSGTDGEVGVDRDLQWKNEKPTYKEEWSGSTLRITSKCPGDPENCETNYTLKVPAGVTVNAKTGAGNVTVRGLSGDVAIDTGSGDITLDGLSGGKVGVKSGAGPVKGTSLKNGEIDIDTGSGTVELTYGTAPSVVKVKTGSDAIRVSLPKGDEGYNVKTSTQSGKQDVTVKVDSTSNRAITATTGSGDVTVKYS
ncbi:DUF4097 family beta strand repeat-containing protein [Longispora albida]|uniref:DUF4097 family beta strand repeat-containing protein n=1 Tax=Longispora albida TaxID=203523 RepID=UPI00035CF743|nr:DUF4097 family beta strand repeat-containing protein [Longispora albida]